MSDSQEITQFLTVEEVADRLRVDPGKLRRWIWEGTIPAFKIGSEVRLVWADVEAALEPVQPYGDELLLDLKPMVEKEGEVAKVNPFAVLTEFAREAERSLKAINRTAASRWIENRAAWEYLAVQVAKVRRSTDFALERIEVWKQRHLTRDMLFNVHVALHEMLQESYRDRFSHRVANPVEVKDLCSEEFVIRDDTCVAVCASGEGPLRVLDSPQEVSKYLERYNMIRSHSRELSGIFPRKDLERWSKLRRGYFEPVKIAVEYLVSRELEKMEGRSS